MTTQTILYGTPTALTITLASLGSSSTLVAGRESTEVDNSTDKFVDAMLRGVITVGTTPTTNTTIVVYLWGSEVSLATTPLDTLDGTDSAETLSSLGVGSGFLRIIKTLAVDSTTSDRGYPMGIDSIAQFFGGNMPKFWGVFVAHNTGVNLNATGSNHALVYTGINYEFT
jgi:hypothetical protein